MKANNLDLRVRNIAIKNNIESLESNSYELKSKIELYKKELMIFGINFEMLVSESPKYRDTKKMQLIF